MVAFFLKREKDSYNEITLLKPLINGVPRQQHIFLNICIEVLKFLGY